MPGGFQQRGDFAGSSHEFKTHSFGSSTDVVGSSISGSSSNLQSGSQRTESAEAVTEASSNIHPSTFEYNPSLFSSPSVAAAAGFYQTTGGRSSSSALTQMTGGVGVSSMGGSSNSGPDASCQIVARTIVDTRPGIQASARTGYQMQPLENFAYNPFYLFGQNSASQSSPTSLNTSSQQHDPNSSSFTSSAANLMRFG